MKKYYAGIGSNFVPPEALTKAAEIAGFLSQEGYTLRSGHAPGLDQAFEAAAASDSEIFIPWLYFHGSTSPLAVVHETDIYSSLTYHPTPHTLHLENQKTLGRVLYELLGFDKQHKVDFLISCIAPVQSVQPTVLNFPAGEHHAVRIAKAYNIPFFNLYDGGDFYKWYSDHNFDIM